MRLLLLVSLVASLAAPVQAAEPSRPNFVFVLMDDLRWDELGCAGHPYVQTPQVDRLAREGALFRNAFATTPLCSPSRASIMTGQYASRHTVVDNVDRSPLSHQLVTFPRLLHDAGYTTAFIGKWHMGVDDSPRPGFDYWFGIKGQGRYRDGEYNENGKTLPIKGYVTDVFTDKAVAFLDQARNKPFCLFLAHKAVHPDLIQDATGRISDPNAADFVPADRHKNLYAGVTVPHRPNVQDDLAGKPALRRSFPGVPPLGPGTGTTDEQIRSRQRMLASADEGLGKLLTTLQAQGRLDDTVVLFSSDHGYFYGEHGLSVERRLAYEEAIRIPLVLRYPRLVKAGSRPEADVLTIDFAPTLLELAGVQPPATMQGRSFVSVLKGKPAEPRSFLIEYYSDTDVVFPRMKDMGYDAVRMRGKWKYIRYRHLANMDELYDLTADPYELKNLIRDPAAGTALAEARATLERLRKKD